MIRALVSDFALDDDGDIEVKNGETRLAVGAEAIALDWESRLTQFKGEWDFDRRVGIDYRAILNMPPPAAQTMLRHTFETVTRDTAGVKTLDKLEFTIDRATRELTVNAEVTSDTGETVSLEFNEVLFEGDEAAA